VWDFAVARNHKTLAYQSFNRLRVMPSGDKPNGDDAASTRKSGWINLGRVRISVLPGLEWRQMFREAWRLQRDQFWTPDMSQVDWVGVHDRYLPLVDRVSSRAEFSDLMWEMQGELGTSHAYEFGGDYRIQPVYFQGFLGADFTYNETVNAWEISHIYSGDGWNEGEDSPLNQPGVNLAVGDKIATVNGRRLNRFTPPGAALVNQAGSEVTLGVYPANGEESQARSVTVKTLGSDMMPRYREWVETNRSRVHAATDGRIGYLHIPDMGGWGYAEFHRGFLAEVDRQGLLVDLRFNRGGHVSALLLQKLARRRLGYDTTRWSSEPYPYPPESVLGPMVALTNEYAGSDGDIFSHGFKMMKLGKLIGKRTWGGVIGIWPRHLLVDGTLTTQPEFSFWFQDVGWGVENYGTDPDIEVDIRPQDYQAGTDPQLERAIVELLSELAAQPPSLPDFSQKPSRAIPRLPQA
jgi:tricorn protease